MALNHKQSVVRNKIENEVPRECPDSITVQQYNTLVITIILHTYTHTQTGFSYRQCYKQIHYTNFHKTIDTAYSLLLR